MTVRWAFLAALAATGALLFRHPAAPWALTSGWDLLWVIPAVSAAALFTLWRFPARGWAWVLVVGAAVNLIDGVVWIANWPPDRESDFETWLRVTSVVTTATAVLLLLGVLGGASRLRHLGHRARPAVLAGTAATCFLIGGPLALRRLEPSAWDVVPFIAAGLALAGAAGAVLITWRDTESARGAVTPLVTGLAAIAVTAGTDVYLVLTGYYLRERTGPGEDDAAEVIAVGVVSVALLLALAAVVAWRAAPRTLALVLTALAGSALLRIGIRYLETVGKPPDAPVDHPLSALSTVAVFASVVVFGAVCFAAHLDPIFIVAAVAAGIALPPLGAENAPMAVVAVAAAVGLTALVAAATTVETGGGPLAPVVLVGLVAIPAVPSGERVLGSAYPEPMFTTSWLLALLLVAAALLVLVGRALRPRPTERPHLVEVGT
ncbi:hypothetical protein V5P93_004837 [Actinokineospora auranticolor]|nr:hypothetical protein [Actinokineospora auranticolor]